MADEEFESSGSVIASIRDERRGSVPAKGETPEQVAKPKAKPRTAPKPAQVATTEGEESTTQDESAGDSTAPAKKVSDDGSPEKLLGALRKERERGDAVERELKKLRSEYEAAQKKAAEPPPKKPEELSTEAWAKLFANPHEALTEVEERAFKRAQELFAKEKAEQRQKFVQRCQARAMAAHADYGEAIAAVQQANAKGQLAHALVQEIEESDDPAATAYEIGKDLMLAGGETRLSKLREKWLKEHGIEAGGNSDASGDETEETPKPTKTIAGMRGNAPGTQGASDGDEPLSKTLADLRAERRKRKSA